MPNRNLALEIAATHLAREAARKKNRHLMQTAAQFARISKTTRSAAAQGLQRAKWVLKSTESLIKRLGSRRPVAAHTIDAMLASGANPNARDFLGETPLILAAKYGHTTVIHSLIAAGAKVNARDIHGDTALLCAAWIGDDGITQKLTKAGANVHGRDADGKTALVIAAENGFDAVVSTLLAAGADVNTKTIEGETVLMVAIEHGRDEVVKRLIRAGANVNIRDKDGRPAWMHVRARCLPETVRMFQRALEKKM